MTLHTNTPTGKRRTAYVLGLRDGGSSGDALPEGSPEATAAIARVRAQLASGRWKAKKPAPPPKRVSRATLLALSAEVEALHRDGVSQREIATRLGIGQSSVSRIVRGEAV